MPESAGAGGEALIRAQVHEGDGSKTTQLSGRRSSPFVESMGGL
jgi:hypothetical protein